MRIFLSDRDLGLTPDQRNSRSSPSFRCYARMVNLQFEIQGLDPESSDRLTSKLYYRCCSTFSACLINRPVDQLHMFKLFVFQLLEVWGDYKVY